VIARRIYGVVIALLAVFAASSAFAHATLLKSDPADGSVVESAPAELVLVFNEPVSPIDIRLIASDGTGIDLTQVSPHNEQVSVPLPALAKGTHALSWRVVSTDGHPVGGSIVFSVGAPSSMATSVQSSPPLTRAIAIWVARFALYLGLFVGVGGAFFLSWIAAEPQVGWPRTTSRVALVAALVSAVVSLGLQGLDLLDVPFASAFTAVPWAAAINSTYAWTLLLAALASALALAGWRWSTGCALVLVGLALAASGHASNAQPQFVTRPSVFIHGVAVTFWVGSLIPLLANKSTTTLQRFSRIVPLPIALLVVSGLTLAAIQLGSPSAIPATPYGRIFAIKMLLVIALLALAAWNRWRLTPGAAHQALARSIAVEIALVFMVLGVVAGWRFTPPPRALAEAAAAAEPLHIHIHSEKAMADVSVSPGRAGPVSVSLAIQDGEFAELPAKAVTLTLSNPAAGIEPIRREARHLDGVIWRVDGLIVPAPGVWNAKVDILVSEFSQVTLQAPLTIPP
jgi:copper transport protein